MLLGYIFQVKKDSAYSFNKVEVRANINLYINQVTKVLKDDKDTVAKWYVFRRLAKNEEVFPL